MSMVANAQPIPVAAEMIPDLTLEEVSRRLRATIRLLERSDRVLALGLLEMEGARLYLSTGHRSTEDYAEARLKVGRQRALELLRVGRTLGALPDLDRAFCAGRIPWTTVLMRAGISPSVGIAFARFRGAESPGSPLDAPAHRVRASGE